MESSDNFSNRDFSNSSDEQKLKLEVEILKLKMQAEYGAMFESSPDLPPQMEYDFLKSVLQFEEAVRDNRNPNDFKLIKTDGVFDFGYKELYLDHKQEIKNCAVKFIDALFQHDNFECSNRLNDQFVLPDGRQLNKEDVINKIKRVSASFNSTSPNHYFIEETDCQWNERSNCGLGHAEGVVRFDMLSTDGTKTCIEEKFKFYMSSEGFGWSIFYFVFPGFDW